MSLNLDRFKGCLLGLACGDSVGTTLEFKKRGTFEPITDMVGGGPFGLEPGQWTDDTSMALCLAESLIERQKFDAVDQMQRYCDWMNKGHLSSNGKCFDIGVTVSRALRDFEYTGEAYSGSDNPYSAGNGALMRLAPVPMCFCNDLDDVIHYSELSSKTTHGADECLEAAKLFGAQLYQALHGESKEAILKASGYIPQAEKVVDLATASFINKDYEVLTGSGYVIESLESALWCFYHSDNYRDAILLSANIGNDADTTAAICGQIAGAYYGFEGIPVEWRGLLAMGDAIEVMAVKLFEFEP